MSKFLEIIILATVTIEGKLTKHERDELLRVHNEIRQSIMNCEYEQFPPVKGQLSRLTWNYTLENMADINARDECYEYFDNKLLKEFISNSSTYVFKNVEEFQK
ncbi:hypothetical protein EG68_12550 [Paragonimus skrjabini miyazakii]|uniref:SCP domain-containing protein n=1 Tax=Paragonimus skrjabini miyazakii TaxID=59628 RepID=A0A8S9YC88_9TREM|nr:hypothetical protein EG68_12550 [Paragonimus skrjabini miyazakii]